MPSIACGRHATPNRHLALNGLIENVTEIDLKPRLKKSSRDEAHLTLFWCNLLISSGNSATSRSSINISRPIISISRSVSLLVHSQRRNGMQISPLPPSPSRVCPSTVVISSSDLDLQVVAVVVAGRIVQSNAALMIGPREQLMKL